MAITKQKPMMNNVFFQLLRSFNNTITPRPELTKRPANKAPKDKEPFKYNSVINQISRQLF